MTGSLFDGVTIPLPCPKCSQKTDKTVAWLKANKEMTCAACGTVSVLEPDELLRVLKDIDDAAGKIPRTLTLKL